MLHELQIKVRATKDKRNEFGGYSYRTAEGILSAVKPHLPDGMSITLSDDVRMIGEHLFLVATARILNGSEVIAEAHGWAMHPTVKKGMDPSQISGSASSYARKYALQGVLAIDDGQFDPDAADNRDEGAEPAQDRGATQAKNPADQPPPAERRDYLLGLVRKKNTIEALTRLLSNAGFSAALDNLPEPMRKEVQAAIKNREQEINKAIDDIRAMGA